MRSFLHIHSDFVHAASTSEQPAFEKSHAIVFSFIQPLLLECLLAISNESTSKPDKIECNATNLNAATELEMVYNAYRN